MSYVIKKIGNEFVTPSGSAASYTRYLQLARVFPTREEAERNKCGNEVVVSVDEVIAHRD